MDAFGRIAAGEPVPLIEAALAIAVDEYPELDVAGYLRCFEDLADDLRSGLDPELGTRATLHHLSSWFALEQGFVGDTSDYYDPRNSYLSQVLDRRLGIPITLAVLYRAFAASVGVRLDGVNLPGHFVLAFEEVPSDEGTRGYVDVFAGGDILTWSECRERAGRVVGRETVAGESEYPAMSDREILARMLRNLKGIYSRKDLGRCLRVQERLVELALDEPTELRDLGILYLHAGKPWHARRTLERLIRSDPPSAETDAVRVYLDRARREAILLN
jgi:regulator of sirC expression with transglutaminase-like and TPR domain